MNGVITRKHWNEETFQKDVLTNLRRAGRMNVRGEIDKESISAGNANLVAYNSANISMRWSSFCTELQELCRLLVLRRTGPETRLGRLLRLLPSRDSRSTNSSSRLFYTANRGQLSTPIKDLHATHNFS